MQPPPGTWERYWAGDPLARNQLIEAYWTLVQYVGSKVAEDLPSMIERDDLISHGVLGLVDAIGKFDPTKGVKFETYAITRIRGSIIDELRSNDWVPRSVRSNAKKVERARVSLESELDRQPSWTEVADRAELPVDLVRSTLSQVHDSNFASLDENQERARGSDQATVNLGDIVHDRTASPESAYQETEIRQALASAVGFLDEREQAVVALHYIVGLTLSQIGKLIGVTESRVCQMHTHAVLGLRSALVGA
jgi:RNA polymerase sigma factor FliA